MAQRTTRLVMLHELRGLNRRRAVQAQLFDGLLAHEVLLNLARHGHGEVLDKNDMARYLVMGDLAFTELLYLLGGGLSAVIELDPGDDLLAVLWIGHADDLHIADLGMGIEELLDLARVDVFAAAYDQILDAAHDIDIPLGIHRRQVAGMHPVGAINRGHRRLGIVPVADHDAVATRAEFAGLVGRNNLAGRGIDDLDLQVRRDLTDRADAFVQGRVEARLR